MATQDISQLVVEVKSKGIQTAANQLDKLATSSDKAEAAIKRLGTAVVGVNGTMTGGVAQASALVAAMTTLTAVLERMAQSQTRAAATQRTHNEAMAEAHALARGLSGSLGALWVTYGNLAGMGAGIALGASLKGVIEVGKDVENTLEGIRVLGGATTDDIKQMSQAITDLGQGAQGPRDVAEALKVLTLAGLDAKQAMQGVQASLNLAQGGEVSVEKSAETLVQVGTALGYTADAYEHVADVITKAAAASMTSVDSISNAFKSAAAVGSTYGASLQDIALGLSAVANLGIQGTAAGTALKNFYKDMSASTDKVTKTLKDMGMSIKDFRGSDGYFLPLVDVVKKLDDGLGKLSANARTMAQVKLFSQQGLREGAILLQMLHEQSDAFDEAGNRLNKLEKLQKDIADAAAFSNLAAIAMGQTTTNQLKGVASTLQSTFATVFKDVQPQINEIARTLKAAFAGDDFKSGLSTVMTLMADFTKVVIDNVGVLKTLALALIGIKALQFAEDMRKVVLAMDMTAVSARGILASLGPIAIAITGLTLAWQWYKEAKDKALDNKPAEANLKEYGDRVQEAAKKELAMLELKKKGYNDVQAAREAQMQEDAAAADKAKNDALAGVAKMEQASNKLWANMSDNEKKLANSLLEQKGAAFDQNIQRLENTPGAHGLSAIGAAVEYAKAERAHQKALAETNALIARAVEGETTLRKAREQTAALDDKKAKDNRVVGDGSIELSGKTGSDADKYAAALAVFQGQIKEYHKDLEYYQQYEDTAFKAGQIGKLQLINNVADAEVETYRKVAQAAKEQMDIAAKHVDKDGKPDKTADVQRFKDEMDRANDAADQANVMRGAKRLETERAAQSQIVALKVKSLEEQGKFEEAANLKWTSEGKIAWEQAKSDAQKYGDVFPWLTDLVNAYGKAHDDAVNSAKVKDATTAFNIELTKAQATLKGFKTATYGTSIDTMFQSATETSAAFTAQIAKAVAEEEKLKALAVQVGTPEAKKAAEEANLQVKALTDKQKTMWQEVGQTIEDSLTKAFGVSGTAMGELYKASIQFNQVQDANASDRMKQYGDMAQAATGFFDKQSKGYRALNGIAQVFHVAQMARTLAETAANIAAGAAQFFAQSGWGGFAGVAAMGAVMAGLGFAMSGASAHGADPTMTSEYQQAHQGTGTVFGDADAKSASITKAIDDLKSNSDVMLPLTQGMYNSLKNIEAAMTGLTNLAVRNGVNNGSNFSIQTGTLGSSMNKNLAMAAGGTAAFGALGLDISGLATAALGAVTFGIGAVIGALVSKFWGKVSQEVTDTGLTFGGKVSDLISGKGINQYADVKTTTSSWFGLSKSSSSSEQTMGVGDEMQRQFGLIFSGLEDTMKKAATTLGSDSDSVGKAIDSLVLNTTKISLKDLKGQDLQDAINNVISGAMDQIAKAAYPQMEAFQQVGEGYAQTVIRVASGVEQAGAALKKLGVQAISYLDIANKTGDVAYEIAQQSIALKEGASGVGEIMANVTGSLSDLVTVYTSLVAARRQMNNIGLGSGLSYDTLSGAGDLKSLTSDLTTYYDKYFTATEKAVIDTKDLTEQFNNFGFDLPNTREQLRTWIETAASVGDQLKVGQLLSLVDAFDKLQTSLEGLGQVTDPFSDAAVKVAKAAYDNAMSAVENAYTRLETSINKEKDRITVAKDALQKNVDAINNVLTSIGDAVKATAPTPSQSQAFEKAMQVVQSATAAVRNGGDISQISGLDDAIKTLSSNNSSGYANLLDFQRAQGRANSALRDLSEAGTQQVSLAQQQIDLYQKQLDNLDKQLETAKSQLDALKGIDDSVLSVADALANFGSALGVAQAAKSNYDAVVAGNLGGGASAAIESLYKNILGRASDEAGKAFWMDSLLNKGVSMSTITQDFYNSAEFKAKSGIPSFDVGTNNVPADMLAMVHKGERIIPAADNAELQRKLSESSGDTKDNTEDELKLADIAEIIQIGDSANVRKLNEMFRIFQRWEIDGMPATRNTDPTVTV